MMRTWVMLAGLAGSVIVVSAGEGWEATVSAGLNVTSGNSDSTAANAGVTTVKKQGKHETRLLAEVNYGESKTDGTEQTTADNIKGGLEHKYTLNGSFLYSNNSVFRDTVADLDLRLILGLGGGYHLIKSDAAKLDVEIGLAYIREERADDTEDDSVAFRAAARHDQALSETAKLWASVEYLPQTDDFDIYLVNSEAGVEAVLNQRIQLNLRMVLQHRYDSNVPEGRENSDLALISALVYKH
jgi:putative salt-induced outer membrane protein YdiY